MWRMHTPNTHSLEWFIQCHWCRCEGKINHHLTAPRWRNNDLFQRRWGTLCQQLSYLCTIVMQYDSSLGAFYGYLMDGWWMFDFSSSLQVNHLILEDEWKIWQNEGWPTCLHPHHRNNWQLHTSQGSLCFLIEFSDQWLISQCLGLLIQRTGEIYPSDGIPCHPSRITVKGLWRNRSNALSWICIFC